MCHDTPDEAKSPAPRVTDADLEALIVNEYYGRASELFACEADGKLHKPKELQTITICLLVLENGFVLVGVSACAAPENFDENVGRLLARSDAKRKLWALEGYMLRSRLHAEANEAALCE